MQPADEQRFVFKALFLASQLGLSVIVRIIAQTWSFDQQQEILLVALPLSQAGLAALWAGLASSHPAPRWGVVAAVVGFWTFGAGLEPFNGLLFGLMVWLAATVFFVATALRWAGLQHALIETGGTELPPVFADKHQFGLARLLITMAFIAALLAAARFTGFSPRHVALIAVHGIACGLIAWCCLPAILSPRVSWPRATAIVICSAAIGAVTFHLFQPNVVYWISGVGSWETSAPFYPPQPGPVFVLFGAAQYTLTALLLLASLWVFKLCGHAWHRSWRPDSTHASEAG